MKVIGYVRVSTIGQAKDGLGIPTQERMVRAWAKSNGHRLVKIVAENGKSGTVDETERPGLLEALSTLKAHNGKREAEALVLTSLDRLARALHVQEAVLAKAWALGGKVFTVDGGEVLQDDPDDPMRKAMRQMAGVFAELDKNLIVKRLRNGRATKKQKGGYSVGGPPYGWQARDGELVPDAEQQEVIKRIRRWRKQEWSLERIADALNAEKIPARRGRWFAQTVRRVLERAER